VTDALPNRPAPPLPDLSRVPVPDRVVRTRVTRDTRQSVVLGAWRGPADANTDRASLALLQSLLNGQSGRLFEALRNRRSLCYATGLQAARGFAPGMIIAYVLTDPATEEAAATALIEELTRIASEAAPDEEFARARARLIGNLLIARQSNGSRVGHCAVDVLYNRPPNNQAHYVREIASLTPEDVRASAERFLHPESRWEVVLGPARV
jgi:zinc protease